MKLLFKHVTVLAALTAFGIYTDRLGYLVAGYVLGGIVGLLLGLRDMRLRREE